MTRIDDLDGDQLARIWDAINALQSQAPVGFTSVSRGALEITSPEGLIVGKAEGEGAGQGSQRVYGTIEVTGTLRGDGTIDWDGPVQLQGQVDVTGRMRVQGGGRVVASDAGDNSHSMQMFYSDATGRLIAFGVPMEIRAWSSVLELAEDHLRISTVGNASVQLNENGLRIEAAGNAITMSDGGIQIVGNDGAAGTWIEFKDGAVYLHNLPNS